MSGLESTILKFAEALVGVENDLLALQADLNKPQGPPLPETVVKRLRLIQLRAAATITKGYTPEDLS